MPENTIERTAEIVKIGKRETKEKIKENLNK